MSFKFLQGHQNAQHTISNHKKLVLHQNNYILGDKLACGGNMGRQKSKGKWC